MQVEGEVVEQPQLLLRAQAAGHPAPQGPPFGADLVVLVVLDARVEQGPQLLDAPRVERVAIAGTQTVAGQVQPDTLMFGGAAPATRALQQGVEQLAQQRRLPAFASAQPPFQVLAQLAHFFGVDLLRLAAEDALDFFDGFLHARRGSGRYGVVFLFAP